MSERLPQDGMYQQGSAPRSPRQRALKAHASLLTLAICVTAIGMAAPTTTTAQFVEAEGSPPAAQGTPTPATQTQILERLRRATAAPETVIDAQGRTTGSDGLADGAAYIEADQIVTEDDKTLTATGEVEMRHKGTTIRADEVSYDSGAGIIVAQGNAQAIGDDGSVTFARRLTFNETMSTGKGEMIASVSRTRARLFAREFEQVDENTNELKNVIYTPCEICKKDGSPQQPGWSVQASRVTQRKDQEMIYFRNAFLKIKGVPVFYVPYMWAPDPENERASGFMPPRVNTSKRRGFSWEQPYLWSLSPYSELIVSPQFNASVNPFLNVEYNRRFYSGLLQFRIGGTQDAYFDTRGNKNGDSDLRGYVLADGRFKITDNWRWNFTAQHIWDPYVMPDGRRRMNADLFERYSIEDAYSNWNVGDYRVSQRNLINQGHIIRQGSNSWFSVSVANFQTLRVDNAATNIASVGLPLLQRQFIAQDSAFYPVIMPSVEAQWSPRMKILGGRLTFKGSAIGLQHKNFLCAVTPRNSTPTEIDVAEGRAKANCVDTVPAFFREAGVRPSGFDTARVTGEMAWQGQITTSYGLRLVPFAEVRQDYYRLSDLGNGVDDAEVNRTLSTAGLTISYPLMRRFGTTTMIIEPVAQLAVSPEYKFNDFLPLEDSQFIEFDSTNLFSVNRSPGYDLYETGQRLNLGARVNFNFDKKVRFDAVVGRTFRDKSLLQFMRPYQPTATGPIYYYDAYGLADKKSDWVFSGRLDLGAGTYAYSRLRLDADDLRVVQNDSGVSWVRGNRTRMTARYIRNDILRIPEIEAGQVTNFYGPNYENIQLYGRHFLTDRWGVSARIDYDLKDSKFRRSQLGLLYRDDCLSIELVYQRNDTQIYQTNGKRGETVFLRLNLATLGTQKNTFNDVR